MQLYKEIITLQHAHYIHRKRVYDKKKMFMIPVHGVSSDSVIPN